VQKLEHIHFTIMVIIFKYMYINTNHSRVWLYGCMLKGTPLSKLQ